MKNYSSKLKKKKKGGLWNAEVFAIYFLKEVLLRHRMTHNTGQNNVL